MLDFVLIWYFVGEFMQIKKWYGGLFRLLELVCIFILLVFLNRSITKDYLICVMLENNIIWEKKEIKFLKNVMLYLDKKIFE